MPSLFSPLTLRSIILRNRLAVSPMCMYSSLDGHATDFHLVHLASRAVGGFGLILAEATAVSPEGRISPEDAGLWQDSQIEPLARINKSLKTYGATPAIQLAHAGRKASTAKIWGHPNPGSPLSPSEGGWPVVAPSPIPFNEKSQTPHALTIPEILSLQAAFVAAARRALAAGYELIELHAAHGYLFNEFLSPLANHRTDSYGGSFDNRARFLLDTVSAVRQVWPDSLPLAVRLSCTDWADHLGGWSLQDSIHLAQKLIPLGVDLIDCSSGAIIPGVKIPAAPGFQVPFATAIKNEAQIPTAAVGLISEPAHAASIIEEEKADLVLLARQALRDPYFPRHAALALNEPDAVSLPPQYHRS